MLFVFQHNDFCKINVFFGCDLFIEICNDTYMFTDTSNFGESLKFILDLKGF